VERTHPRRSAARRRALPTALAAGLVLSACAPEPEAGLAIRQAELILEPSPFPPEASVPGEAVSLPDTWYLARRREATAGWYRARFELAEAPSELWAVYLGLPGLSSAVYVNGQLVGDGGGFEPPLPHNWSRPLLFTVPAGLLSPGSNHLHVRFATDRSTPAVLGALAVGPQRALEPVFARRHRVQVTLPQLLVAISVAGGLLSAGVYLRRDRTGGARWLVAGLLVWAGAEVQVYARHVGVSPHLWACVGALAQVGFLSCFVMAWHRLLQLGRGRLERWLWAAFAAGALALLAVDSLLLRRALLVWFAGGIALGGYSLALTVEAARRFSGRPSLLVLVPGLAGLAIGLHDVASLLATRMWAGTLLAPWVAPIVIVATSRVVVSRLIEDLAESERSNRELELRVREKHAELERNYERLRELERMRAVVAERERIVQDVHDGLGGQLVSALAMVESGRSPPETIAEALRDALADLRLVIDSLEPTDDDLVGLLAIVRARFEPRLSAHGLRFDWRVADLPPLPGLGPGRALHVLRIVQEAIANVVKHAQARTIQVATGTAEGSRGDPGILIEIRDDGRGFAPQAGRGRGLANMARRAAALDGRFDVESAAGGTCVRLWLPLPSPDAESGRS
jgi:signal transduction histidine kinase